jgi:alpha-galactosidase/6-phospho-beta-glucosidase family protein
VENGMDKALIKEAFMTDPLVKGRVSEEEIVALMEDMMKATL